MIAMIAIYIAGIVSGIILLSIAIAGWVHKSAEQIKAREGKHNAAVGAVAGPPSLEDYRTHRHGRSRRHFAASA